MEVQSNATEVYLVSLWIHHSEMKAGGEGASGNEGWGGE